MTEGFPVLWITEGVCVDLLNRLSALSFCLCLCLSFQPNLYPTVGLQTPGEIVDANFGQQPFVFDIEDYMSEWRAKIHSMIARFPIGERLGDWQAVLQKWVASHLIINSAVAKLIETSTSWYSANQPCFVANLWFIKFLLLILTFFCLYLQYGVQLPSASWVLCHSNGLCQSHRDHDPRGPNLNKKQTEWVQRQLV